MQSGIKPLTFPLVAHSASNNCATAYPLSKTFCGSYILTETDLLDRGAAIAFYHGGVRVHACRTAVSNKPPPRLPNSPDDRLTRNIGGMMSDSVKPKNWENTLCQCHSVHHKSDTDHPGIESGPQR